MLGRRKTNIRKPKAFCRSSSGKQVCGFPDIPSRYSEPTIPYRDFIYIPSLSSSFPSLYPQLDGPRSLLHRGGTKFPGSRKHL